MSTRTIAATAVTIAAVPLALSALLWRGRVLQGRGFVEINPYEVELELRERNDDE